jgi:hypothetical protein
MNRQECARAFVHQILKPGHAWASLPYAYDFEEDGMLFLHYYEDSPKKATAQRLTEAAQAYEARFGQLPNLILVSEQDAAATRPGCEVRVEKRISKDNYQLARID